MVQQGGTAEPKNYWDCQITTSMKVAYITALLEYSVDLVLVRLSRALI